MFNTVRSPRILNKKNISRSVTPVRPIMNTTRQNLNATQDKDGNLIIIIEKLVKLIAVTQQPQTLEVNEKRVILEK